VYVEERERRTYVEERETTSKKVWKGGEYMWKKGRQRQRKCGKENICGRKGRQRQRKCGKEEEICGRKGDNVEERVEMKRTYVKEMEKLR
jgi:hypothetical protein